jgi:methylthioribose-1-phosphate isomerase
MLIDGISRKSLESNDNYEVKIIDQTLLPHKLKYIALENFDDCCRAIKDMWVRGAPLIGVTASYGMYFAVKENPSIRNIQESFEKLLVTRPTAIDLKWALKNIIDIILQVSDKDRAEFVWNISRKLEENSVKQCSKIGDYGLEIIKSIIKKNKTFNILTHCNAGWLACVDWGTALAPIYKAYNSGMDIHVWVDETRPRSQGAALTAWELSKHGVPNTLIVDNAGGHLMQNGKVDMCIVGSDRTAANGDVCNKIGTYMKALCAFDNNIPFYVAIPESTIDFNLKSGVNKIVIEERSQDEVTYIRGIDESGKISKVKITPNFVKSHNPGFDVTPARLVSKLITDKGICNPTTDSIRRLFK